MMIHRLAADQDMNAVYDLYMEPTANPWLTYDPMDRNTFTGIYHGLLNSGTLFVVETDAELIGTYRLIPKADRQSHTLYLGSFTITKGKQGRGWGSQVLDHIKTYAQEHGKTRVELTVDIRNQAAIGLYRKAGFEIEGTVRNSYRLGTTGEYYDEYLMAVLL